MTPREEIAQMLRRMPPDWRGQYDAGRDILRQVGGPSLPATPTPEQAMEIVGITAGGNRADDRPSGRNKVPPKVREEALKGLRLSYDNDYGAWTFIGIARAIQLALSPGVPDSTKERMERYFGRHVKDKQSYRFGDDSDPSRGYMAWLNWGGDAGLEWVAGAKLNPFDLRGQYIPERYLAGLPPDLRTRRIQELTESREAYHTGDYSELPTDRDARRLGLVKPSVYTIVAKRRGIEWRGDSLDMAQRVLAYYGGSQKKAPEFAKALDQVFRKGLAAWKSGGHRPGATAQNWAVARVNSVAVGGKAAWTADTKEFSVLPESVRDQIRRELHEVIAELRKR